MSYPTGSNILGGFCCKWGSYNTHQVRRTLYETGPVQLFGSTTDKRATMQGYLVSSYVKLSSLIADGDYEIYILDTDLDPSAIVSGGLAAVINAGGYAMAISDIKTQSAADGTGGGVFGYDPPTEELVTIRMDEMGRPDSQSPRKVRGYQEIVEMKGRPFYKGLAVVLVDPSDNSISEEGDALFIDVRFLYSYIDPAFTPVEG